MGDDDTALYSVVLGGRMAFEDQAAAIRFVRAVRDSPNFCKWCLCPVVRSVRLEDLQLSTVATFDKHITLVEDYPPGKIDDEGNERPSHTKVEVCDCGWVDKPPNESRKRETEEDALEHVLTLLEEIGAHIDRRMAKRIQAKELDKGHTGQFCETLGTAIYRSTK